MGGGIEPPLQRETRYFGTAVTIYPPLIFHRWMQTQYLLFSNPEKIFFNKGMLFQ